MTEILYWKKSFLNFLMNIILDVTVLRQLNPRNLKLFQNDSDALYNILSTPLICDNSVTTQNLAFFSYWCRKKLLQKHV
jgi:hypothetical protein